MSRVAASIGNRPGASLVQPASAESQGRGLAIRSDVRHRMVSLDSRRWGPSEVLQGPMGHQEQVALPAPEVGAPFVHLKG
jgi:hypothetical protein